MVAFEFEQSFSHWEQRLASDEWYFVRVRERLTENLDQRTSFDEIADVAALALNQSDEYLASECLELLLVLARRSETTEMPAGLNNAWEKLGAHMSGFGGYQSKRFRELAIWYRRNAL